MTDAYLLSPPDDYYASSRYSVGGSAPYSVPRLICPGCGEHASANFEYPGFDVTGFDDEITRHLWRHVPDAPFRKSYEGPTEISLDEMRELSARLAAVLGPAQPFGPFTEFGPLLGRAEGLFSDFSWPSVNSPPYLRRSAFDLIQEAGFSLAGVSSDLAYRREREDPLVVIEVLPTARIHPSLRPELCVTCGYATDEIKRDGARLDASTYDGSIAIQRIFERPYTMVVNAAFADFVRKREFSGFRLTPVAVE